jgi:hypothetical protein
MKYLLLCFLVSAAAFAAEEQEKSSSLPAKKIKPHFAGTRRGSSNKLKYVIKMPKAKKSTDSEQLVPAGREAR